MEARDIGGKSNTLTVDDLRAGRRARVNERELSSLIGRSTFALQRDRWKGKGTPFQKDERGRVWYSAGDVLDVIDRPRHRGTNEYDTSEAVERLAKARTARQQSIAP